MIVERAQQRGQPRIGLEGALASKAPLDERIEHVQERRVDACERRDMHPLPAEADEDDRREDEIDPAVAELADGDGEEFAERRARRS